MLASTAALAIAGSSLSSTRLSSISSPVSCWSNSKVCSTSIRSKTSRHCRTFKRYREKVRQCLDVFERMLVEHTFEFDQQLTGLEIELNLVDDKLDPAMANAAVLANIADPAYQTELGQYNIELNVEPHALPGDLLLELERKLRSSL